MKQINECLTRAFEGQRPKPSAKWKAAIVDQYPEGDMLYLFHYHHRVLVYSLDKARVVYEWSERPADRRGLNSAKMWLTELEERTERDGAVYCMECVHFLRDEPRKYPGLCHDCGDAVDQ